MATHLRIWIFRALIFIAIGGPGFASLTIADLNYLGNKPAWNQFDKARVKTYMLTWSMVGMIVPPIGPLEHIGDIAVHGYHFTTKTLPDNKSIDALRGILVDESFCKKLAAFANTLKIGNASEPKWATKRIVHRVFFGTDFGMGNIFDDWAVVLAGTASGDGIQLSYFVWGLGIVPDERAETFFGQQLGPLAIIFPLRWSNRVEEYGLAKGYWVLLTESDATSGFSYQARTQKSGYRISRFLAETRKIHFSGEGKTYGELCS